MIVKLISSLILISIILYTHIYVYRVLKNYVYNVSGMIENVKTNKFFI